MRLSDISDYFALRRHVLDPWSVLRLRGRPAADVDIRMREGGSIHLRPVAQDRHTFHRIFARDEYRLGRERAGAFPVVIDVGAHIGLFARRVAPLAGKVLSFEPVAANFETLKRNVAGLSNVTPIAKAVSEKRGKQTIFTGDNPAAHSMFPAEERFKSGGQSIDCVTLADVFEEQGLERCDLLKLDCEGAEYGILYSFPAERLSRIRRICMEYHPVAGGAKEWSGAALAEHLDSAGHHVELIPSRKNPEQGHLFSFCPKPVLDKRG